MSFFPEWLPERLRGSIRDYVQALVDDGIESTERALSTVEETFVVASRAMFRESGAAVLERLEAKYLLRAETVAYVRETFTEYDDEQAQLESKVNVLRETVDNQQSAIEKRDDEIEKLEKQLEAETEDRANVVRALTDVADAADAGKVQLLNPDGGASDELLEAVRSAGETSDVPEVPDVDDPHEWQSAASLAAHLEVSKNAVPAYARHYEKGHNTDTPVERRSNGTQNEYRVPPPEADEPDDEESGGPSDETSDESDESAVYLLCDEVPGGFVPERCCDRLETAQNAARKNYDESTCDPAILRATDVVPDLNERIRIEEIEANDTLEIVQ